LLTYECSNLRLSSLTTTSLVVVQLAVAQVAVPAGRHRPVAAGTLVDTWWFITIITIITWFTRLGVDTSGHPCCCERVPGLGTVIIVSGTVK
jgi:hypothetical protein